jgi:hypothetical protein
MPVLLLAQRTVGWVAPVYPDWFTRSGASGPIRLGRCAVVLASIALPPSTARSLQGFSPRRTSSWGPECPCFLPSQPPDDLQRAGPCQRARHQDQVTQGSSSRPRACPRPSRRLRLQGPTSRWLLNRRREEVRPGLRPRHQLSHPGAPRGATYGRGAYSSWFGKGSRLQPPAHSADQLHASPHEMGYPQFST